MITQTTSLSFSGLTMVGSVSLRVSLGGHWSGPGVALSPWRGWCWVLAYLLGFLLLHYSLNVPFG